MNHTSRLAIVLVTAAFAACPSALHAQTAPLPAPLPAPTAQAVTLRYKFAVGQVHRYQYDMGMNMLMMTGQTGAGVPITMTMQMTMRQMVKSIRPTDGAATLISQIESMHMLRNGQETPMPEAQQAQMKQSFTQVMLPTGKILSIQMPSFGGAGVPGMDFSKGMFSGTAFLPEGPVKIGDFWNGSGMSPMVGMQMAFTSTLAGLNQKNGATLATIQSKQTGTINTTMTKGVPVPITMQAQITGTGTQVLDTNAGAIQSATGASSTDMTMTFGKAADGSTPPGMPSAMKMQMQMQFTMQRLSDSSPATPPLK